MNEARRSCRVLRRASLSNDHSRARLAESNKELFSQAVEERLQRDGAHPAQPAWKALAGELAPLRKETRRIETRINDAFGKVDE